VMQFHVNGLVQEALRTEWPKEWGPETGELWELQGPNLHPGDEIQWSGESPSGPLWVRIQVNFPPRDQPRTGYLRLREGDRFHA
jgi:hypothetical protein